MEHFEYLEKIIEVLGIGVLFIGAILFLIEFFKFGILHLRGMQCVEKIQELRVGLGGYILLSLELLIISDIISTTISRELLHLAELATLVAIRTAISYFLGKEIEGIQEQQKEKEKVTAPPQPAE